MISLIVITMLSITASTLILQCGNYLRYKHANKSKERSPNQLANNEKSMSSTDETLTC